MRPSVRKDRVCETLAVEFRFTRLRDGLVLPAASHFDRGLRSVREPSSAYRKDLKKRGVIRIHGGGLIQFWTLGNPNAGRSRGYKRVVIDEAAFTKNGDTSVDGSMMSIWEKSIKPTLLDYDGEALVLSNSAGKNPDNFFIRYARILDRLRRIYAPTSANPLPKRLENESEIEWLARRDQVFERLKADNAPLVYAQEYEADFVDWSGAAFFARDKLLVDGQPVAAPGRSDGVFAIIDTASKTGTDHDATAVTYFAINKNAAYPLLILDWDITQIEEHCSKLGFRRYSPAWRSLHERPARGTARLELSSKMRIRVRSCCNKRSGAVGMQTKSIQS
jgi:hypothetical protein